MTKKTSGFQARGTASSPTNRWLRLTLVQVFAVCMAFGQMPGIKLPNGQKIAGSERLACLDGSFPTCSRLFDWAIAAGDMDAAGEFAGNAALRSRERTGEVAWMYGTRFGRAGAVKEAKRMYQQGCEETNFPSALACFALGSLNQLLGQPSDSDFAKSCAVARIGCDQYDHSLFGGGPYQPDLDGQRTELETEDEYEASVAGSRSAARTRVQQRNDTIQQVLNEQLGLLRQAGTAAQSNSRGRDGAPRCGIEINYGGPGWTACVAN
jgi:hypothetical protein